MKKGRRNFPAKFKAKVALDAVTGSQTLAELSTRHEVHAAMISNWKKTLTDRADELFDTSRGRASKTDEELKARLYQQIGELQSELSWLKKKARGLEMETRSSWIETQSELSIRKQCELAGVTRSSWYYEPCGERQENLIIMRLIDEQYTKTPFYGSPRMCCILRQMGYRINVKRVERLMRLMGIQAIYPKKNLSKAVKDHEKHPYLLRGVKIERPNQVWSTDITYIRMRRGFLYLCAVIDWRSRMVLSWRLSNTQDGDFCIETLKDALSTGAKPEIFNTDQGSQFTSPKFLKVLIEQGIRISMDGKGRALDNVFIERLWRDVKYEHVYLHEYENGLELHKGLKAYFQYRNMERPHEALKYKVPWEVYNNTQN